MHDDLLLVMTDGIHPSETTTVSISGTGYTMGTTSEAPNGLLIPALSWSSPDWS